MYVRFPSNCQRTAVDLVHGLCRDRPEERLREAAVWKHPWFFRFNWNELRTLQYKPPYLPTVTGPRDLANFRSCEDDDPPLMVYQDSGNGWDADFGDDGTDTLPEAPVAMSRCSSSEASKAPLDAAAHGRTVAAAGKSASWTPRPVAANSAVGGC